MSDKESHLAQAEKNQLTIDYLLGDSDKHPEWIATIAFYKAVHLVEALFSTEKKLQIKPHSNDHSSRLDTLKKNNRYLNIFKHFRPLFNASIIARYLCDDKGSFCCFRDYYTIDDVKNKILNHHLKQIENTVAKMLPK
jgi:hypothetical protein